MGLKSWIAPLVTIACVVSHAYAGETVIKKSEVPKLTVEAFLAHWHQLLGKRVILVDATVIDVNPSILAVAGFAQGHMTQSFYVRPDDSAHEKVEELLRSCTPTCKVLIGGNIQPSQDGSSPELVNAQFAW